MSDSQNVATALLPNMAATGAVSAATSVAASAPASALLRRPASPGSCSGTMAAPGRNVVMLMIDGLKLILPQGDIRSVASVVDLDTRACAEGAAGWISYAGRAWPAYCLSSELHLLEVEPMARRACALLALANGYIGLLCDDVRVLMNFSVQAFEVPPAMRQAASPLSGLLKYEEALACVSDAGRLAAFIEFATQGQQGWGR